MQTTKEERRLVQKKLQCRVSRGIIIKPTNCQYCQKPFPKEKLEGHHHHGYENPYDVVWLCRSCHLNCHQDIRSGENNANARLTEKEVVNIRSSSLPYKTLGEIYGVGQNTIGRIKTGESYRDRVILCANPL